MAREDAIVVEQFKKVVVSHLKDVLIALPALVPQTKEDEILFKEGMKKINELVYRMEHTENIRELSRYLDVDRIVRDFDSDSIRMLDSRINASARNSISKLDEMVEQMGNDLDDRDNYE